MKHSSNKINDDHRDQVNDKQCATESSNIYLNHGHFSVSISEYRRQHLYRLPPYGMSPNPELSQYAVNPIPCSVPKNESYNPSQHHPNLASHLSMCTKSGTTLTSQPLMHGLPPIVESFKRAVPTLNNSVPKKTSNRRPYPIIKSVQLDGKSLSCILRDPSRTQYALLEAVCRAFFPKLPLLDFINIVEITYQLCVFKLSTDEEECIIRFYGLKASSLQCLKVVEITELKKVFTNLKTTIANKLKSMNIIKATESELINNQKLNAKSTQSNSESLEHNEPVLIQPFDDEDEDTDLVSKQIYIKKPGNNTPDNTVCNPSKKRTLHIKHNDKKDDDENITEQHTKKRKEECIECSLNEAVICGTDLIDHPNETDSYKRIDTLDDSEDYMIIDTLTDVLDIMS